MLLPALNLPRGVAVALEKWGVAMVVLEQVLRCGARAVPAGVHIPLWLDRLSVPDQLQTSGHRASLSVPGCHQRPHPRFAHGQWLLRGLCGARASGQRHLKCCVHLGTSLACHRAGRGWQELAGIMGDIP